MALCREEIIRPDRLEFLERSAASMRKLIEFDGRSFAVVAALTLPLLLWFS